MPEIDFDSVQFVPQAGCSEKSGYFDISTICILILSKGNPSAENGSRIVFLPFGALLK